MFTENFDAGYVCPDESITTYENGFTVTARIVFDDCHNIDDDDVHNIDQSVTGCDDEQYEKLLAARTAWFDGEWFYCGIVLAVAKNGIVLDNHAASLWGIEANYPGSNNEYLREVANELLPEAIETGEQVIESLCKN